MQNFSHISVEAIMKAIFVDIVGSESTLDSKELHLASWKLQVKNKTPLLAEIPNELSLVYIKKEQPSQ